MRIFISCFIATLLSLQTLAQVGEKSSLKPSDLYKLTYIDAPQISPSGKWVAYTAAMNDTAKDKRITHIWMVSWDGKETLQLTNSDEGESNPRWSPDGKYLSFISSRQGEKNAQLWLMDTRGGEAKKITAIKGDVEDYVWSPDAAKIALTIKDEDFSDTAKSKTRKPFVTERYLFKKDMEGYLEKRYSHLYVLNVAAKKMDTLTSGPYDDSAPSWSPDGKQLAFVNNRSAEREKNENSDIFIIDAVPNATSIQLTTWRGTDDSPQWSPDGKWIAYTSSSSNENFTMYGQERLAVVPAAGGQEKIITAALDRPVGNIQWSKDGNHIYMLVSDDRKRYVAAADVNSSKIETIATGEKCFSAFHHSLYAGATAAVMSEPQLPSEIYAIENNTVRRLTHMQDSFVQAHVFASVQGFTSISKDGTSVSNILYLPPNAAADKKLPLIMFIHGGPVGQDEYEFDSYAQTMAAAGYAVASVNYRGSSGRGAAYTRAIYADWGNKEVMDILGAVDYLVKNGTADGDKIGIGGWSYGGILTNYCIATDTRFKAAASGAGSSLQLSMYGTDQYITQYENELGTPWKNPKKWMALSYPFFKVDKIKTPVLFMASQNDFNVPVAGAEQMYQALRSTGVPAALVIYPGQNHGLTKPSYEVDRLERYLQWFGKYLK